jgi:putative transposase
MSTMDRFGLVDPADAALSVMAQCRLLKVARSTLYYRPLPGDPDDLAVTRRMLRG